MNLLRNILYKNLFFFGSNLENKFNAETISAIDINKKMLFDILKENENTEYGEKHNFNKISSIEEYKKNVQLGTYDDFSKYIQKELNGKSNILTKDKVEYFAHSSGTTGSQKILPITKKSRNIALQLNGLLCQKFIYNCFQDKWSNGRGVMLVDMIQGDNSNNTNITSASSGGMIKVKRISQYLWTSPVEIMDIKDKECAFYLHILFALKEKSLMYIGGMFISSVLDFFRILEKNQQSFIDDLKNGTISSKINIDLETREKLSKKLGRCTKRSKELEIEFKKGFKSIAKRIWPNLLYIASVTGANFANYNDIVNYYSGNLPICSIAYATTEGFIGVNPYHDKIEYILVPTSCFFEFIKISDIYSKNPKTYLLNELELNLEYEIVLTTYNGLYRYRLGDIIKVTGYYNNTPKIQFKYRKNQLLNMVSEKTTEDHVKTALQNIAHEYKLNILDYTTYPDNNISPGRYIFYLEIEKFNSKDGISLFEYKLDSELQKCNLAYERFRRGNRLGKLKVKFVKRGTFKKYKDLISKDISSTNQIKTPRVIYDNSKIENILSNK